MIRINISKKLQGADGPFQLEIDLTLDDREFLSLFGPSGSGKTTVLRCLAGLTDPDEGLIKFGDSIWFDSSARVNLPPQKRSIGFVFQDYALFPHYSVRQNLEYALENKQDKTIVYELLQIAELETLAHVKPDKLSGGQKQRLALVRALVKKPSMLLLDEPMSALDRATRQRIQDEILKLYNKYNIPVILVSHDLAEVFKLAPRVVLLEKGRIIKQGSPLEVFTDGQTSGKFKFAGEIVDVQKSDVVYILVILVGNNIVRTVASETEVAGLAVGDKVMISSKAFNPLVMKIN